MNNLPKSLLVIAPHPDDDIIGVGGLLAKMSRNGLKSTVVYGTGSIERQLEAANALKILDNEKNLIDYYFLHPKKDNVLSEVPMVLLIKQIENLINAYKPEMVVIPTPNGFHQDHRYISMAAISALRPSGTTNKHMVKNVAVYEEVSDCWSLKPTQENLNLYIQLNKEDVDKKCKAMSAHISQNRPFPSERSEDAIRSLAAIRGTQSECEYAEAYYIKRWTI